jgi:Tol biopolymer transport system component
LLPKSTFNSVSRRKNTWQEEKLFTTLPDQQNKTVTMWEPSWAPDGKKAAYVLWYITGEIYLMSLDDQSTTRLTDNDFDDKNPAWSPDGTQIAFSTNRDDNYEIYLMDKEGNNLVRLTENGFDDGDPCWSPDGTKIAFTSHRDGNNDIFTMNADGSNFRNLTRHSADDIDPAWSPDGTQIAFSTNRDDNYEIYLMDTRGTNQQKLTDNPSLDTEPCWSPDGKQILFTSDRSGTSNLYLLTLGQEYAEPFFWKGYLEQIDNYFQLFQNLPQPDDELSKALFTQQLLILTNLILQIKTYQLELIEKPKFLMVWQADWVGGK